MRIMRSPERMKVTADEAEDEAMPLLPPAEGEGEPEAKPPPPPRPGAAARMRKKAEKRAMQLQQMEVILE